MPDGYKGAKGLEGAQGLFGDLTKGQGGKDVSTDAGYPGTLIQLPNGDYIGIRPVSDSGAPTVDTKISGAPRESIKFKFP